MKKITREEAIAALVPEAGLTPLEVAALEVLSARALRLLACDRSAARSAAWLADVASWRRAANQ